MSTGASCSVCGSNKDKRKREVGGGKTSAHRTVPAGHTAPTHSARCVSATDVDVEMAALRWSDADAFPHLLSASCTLCPPGQSPSLLTCAPVPGTCTKPCAPRGCSGPPPTHTSFLPLPPLPHTASKATHLCTSSRYTHSTMCASGMFWMEAPPVGVDSLPCTSA